jgi:hypothetical protein
MERTKRLDEAAEQLANLIEGHLTRLPASEREAKSEAFHQSVAKIGTRAKSAGPPKVQESRRPVRRQA